MAEASDCTGRYYLFDLLWHKGEDFTFTPVLERRERLAQIISPVDGIRSAAGLLTEAKNFSG
jgi:ATP-dependent DNA ligase